MLDVNMETEKLLEELKKAFGVKTTAAVLKKSLELSRFMARNADDTNVVVIETKDHERIKLLLAGKSTTGNKLLNKIQ